mmetsp:Transcript_52718/g.94118  ORF Transcript_52718/g.94118 Transcript_52718/m.94118 type:complete len:918 (-) Transcript_52718:1523-4276(-)
MAGEVHKTQYIRSPFLDERFQQNKISASPYSSAKRSLVRVEKALPPISAATQKPIESDDAFKQRSGGVPRYFSCKMNFPASLTTCVHQTTHQASTADPTDLADGNEAPATDEECPSEASSPASLAAAGSGRRPHAPPNPQVAAAFASLPGSQQPNPYWQHPPPTFDPLPDYNKPQAKPKKDEYHPLLATSGAAAKAYETAVKEAAKAAARAKLPQTTPMSPTSPDVTQDPGQPPAEGEDGVSLTTRAALMLSQALFSPLPPHAIPANAASAANHLRPAGATGVRLRQRDQLVPDIASNNNYQNKTFQDLNNLIIPPAAAFRTLQPEIRYTLQLRDGKTRSKLENELQQLNPVMEPAPKPMRPPTPPEEGAEGEEGEGDEQESQPSEQVVPGSEAELEDLKQEAKDGFQTTEVRYNAQTGEFEIVGEEEEEEVDADDAEAETEIPAQTYSLEAKLGMASQFNLWNQAVQSRCEQEDLNADPDHAPTPLDEVVGLNRVRVITSKLASIYHTTLRKAAMQDYLMGQGQRMGSTLLTNTAPSTSSFTTGLPEHQKRMNAQHPPTVAGPSSGIGPTPPAQFHVSDDPCTFAFLDSNLRALVMENGGEVEEVWLEGQRWLGGATVEKIGEFCPSLRLLNLAGCRQVPSPAVARIAEGCRLLGYVNLNGCTAVSGEAVAHLLHYCTQLEVLCLSGLAGIDEGCSTFRTLHSARNLRALDLSYCPTLTDQSLVSIATYCPSLEWLNISGCSLVGDLGVGAIGSKLARLSVLIMKLCSQEQLTANGLQAVAKAPRNLKRLDVSGVTQLNDATLSTIIKQSPCLQGLAVSGCRGITDASIAHLSYYCKKLQSLELDNTTNLKLQTLMDLVNDVPSLTSMSVTNSCVSKAEVTMLSAIRPNCHISKNEFQPPANVKLLAIPYPEVKKK